VYDCARQYGVSAYKFTGQERDSESGLDYFKARHDSSQYGRFMTTDPADNAATCLLNPQTQDRYAYVTNNPVNSTDPTGLCGTSDDPIPCDPTFPWWIPIPIVGGISIFGPGGGGDYPPPPKATAVLAVEALALVFLDSSAQDQSVPPECQISFLDSVPETGVCRGSAWSARVGMFGSGLHVGTGLSVTAEGDGDLIQTTGPAMDTYGSKSSWEVPFKFIRTGKKGETPHITWTVSYQCEGKPYVRSHVSTAAVCR
jgi:RHS repeat-associated protein